MFSDGGSSEAIRTSSSKFSFVSPPNRSSKAPGARHDCKRDLRMGRLCRNFGKSL
ncbi:hypothetical protein Prudu_005790, partial [Prunus dulcis]